MEWDYYVQDTDQLGNATGNAVFGFVDLDLWLGFT